MPIYLWLATWLIILINGFGATDASNGLERPKSMETEEFFVISSKYVGGGWSKFAKSYDLPGLNAIPFFYDEEKAIHFLNNNLPPNCREFFGVFRVVIELKEVEKVFDGRTKMP